MEVLVHGMGLYRICLGTSSKPGSRGVGVLNVAGWYSGFQRPSVGDRLIVCKRPVRFNWVLVYATGHTESNMPFFPTGSKGLHV